MEKHRPQLWGTVNPDYVSSTKEGECAFTHCTLLPDHDGPHLDAHYISGRVFGIWNNNGPVFGPDDVSDEAIGIVKEVNGLRNKALDAIEAAVHLHMKVSTEYADLTKGQDPILYDLIRSRDFWPSEQNLAFSGTEGSSEEAIREELTDMFVLNGAGE